MTSKTIDLRVIVTANEANDLIQAGVVNSMVPSAVRDTGVTSHAFLKDNLLIPANERSSAMFHFLNGATTAVTMIHKLHHKLREPAQRVNNIPSLVANSLLSTGKMIKVGYFAVYDKREVNFYDVQTTSIAVSKEAVLKGLAMPPG
jgi:hypothetical protein